MITLYTSQLQPIEVKSFTFPGGEIHCDIPHLAGHVLLDARVHSPADFISLVTWTDAARRAGAESINLLIPYFPGARQDRVPAGQGLPLTVKVHAEIVNAQNYRHVFILDPHSDVTPALVDRSVVLPPQEVLAAAPQSYDGLICPDAGAEKRSYAIAERLGLTRMIFCRKHRDMRTGKLAGFSVEHPPTAGRWLLADDICDGGATFVGLAEKLPGVALDLYVSHGIFSKGLAPLLAAFQSILTTDSWPVANAPRITVFPVLETFRTTLLERLA